MELWVYDSDGLIYLFTTRERALRAFKEWYVEEKIPLEEREDAILQMDVEGYYYNERIYSSVLID